MTFAYRANSESDSARMVETAHGLPGPSLREAHSLPWDNPRAHRTLRKLSSVSIISCLPVLCKRWCIEKIRETGRKCEAGTVTYISGIM